MDRDSAAPSYAFRDHDLAARRLALVAETFAPLTSAFLNEAVTGQPSVAIDLGCGLGHSTRIISTVATPQRTIGLDQSEAFLAGARETTTGNVEFIVHDVTQLPLPGEPADFLFCRFLLVHLPEPRAPASALANAAKAGRAPPRARD
jgi:trans-aconitate 2-methyltransferase